MKRAIVGSGQQEAFWNSVLFTIFNICDLRLLSSIWNYFSCTRLYLLTYAYWTLTFPTCYLFHYNNLYGINRIVEEITGLSIVGLARLEALRILTRTGYLHCKFLWEKYDNINGCVDCHIFKALNRYPSLYMSNLLFLDEAEYNTIRRKSLRNGPAQP